FAISWSPPLSRCRKAGRTHRHLVTAMRQARLPPRRLTPAHGRSGRPCGRKVPFLSSRATESDLNVERLIEYNPIVVRPMEPLPAGWWDRGPAAKVFSIEVEMLDPTPSSFPAWNDSLPALWDPSAHRRNVLGGSRLGSAEHKLSQGLPC